jgi:hypothetical protein
MGWVVILGCGMLQTSQGCPFSRSREKVPEADEGSLWVLGQLALTLTLSREREGGLPAH